MLTKPQALYKGEIPAKEAPGGWNLQGRQFTTSLPKTKGKLVKWGCLTLHTSRDKGSYESTINEFVGSLKNCGIDAGKPLAERLEFNPKKGDYFDKKGRDLLGMIEYMQQQQTMRPGILLIVLPAKDTVLNNKIKKHCDQTLGIHTVCAVGSAFRKEEINPKTQKPQSNHTYYANVALKVNLKLGGTNHTLEKTYMGIVSKGQTMVVGIDVVHPSPGSGKASVASMVASIDKDLAQWPVDLQVQVREGQEMLDKINIMLLSRLAL